MPENTRPYAAHCANHPDFDSMDSCSDCGKPLCRYCANKFYPPLCDVCATARIGSECSRSYKSLWMMVIGCIVGIGLALSLKLSPSSAVLLTLIFTCVPWGWRTLTAITPAVFLVLPLVGWLFYFASKFLLASLIGIFVTPYQLIKAAKGLHHMKNMESLVGRDIV